MNSCNFLITNVFLFDCKIKVCSLIAVLKILRTSIKTKKNVGLLRAIFLTMRRPENYFGTVHKCQLKVLDPFTYNTLMSFM
jgi:hypothetical protein